MIKKICLLMVVVIETQPFLFSQTTDTITEKEVSRIIHYLAADSLKGRGNGSRELLKAASFLGNEFRKNDLVPLPGVPAYYLPFRPFGGSKKIITDFLYWNGKPISEQHFLYVSPAPGNYREKRLQDFRVIKMDSFFAGNVLKRYVRENASLLLWTDKKQPGDQEIFPDILETPPGGLSHDVLMVYAGSAPDSLSLTGNPSWYANLAYNVVATLPGKSKPGEAIIFSAHYDHEGVFGGRKDSIMNGANDNASGTTALIALANYFSKRNDNERTLMFCAFAGEELGLLGSTDFINQVNPDKIVAVINLEMLGVPELGRNRVFITGAEYSDLPAILRKGLTANGINVRPEPNPMEKKLFMRSDNFPFAKKGIPAHTIMGSTDDDRCYHQPCDEVRRIDIPNLTRLARAIAASVRPLISGQLTPSRIRPSDVDIKEEF
jgi:hypothetical protein